MEFLILGLVVAINFVIIMNKFKKSRYEDAIFDCGIFAIIMLMFSGSYAGLIVGSIASLFISIYLYASPPKFFSGKSGYLKQFVNKAKENSIYKD